MQRKVPEARQPTYLEPFDVAGQCYRRKLDLVDRNARGSEAQLVRRWDGNIKLQVPAAPHRSGVTTETLGGAGVQHTPKADKTVAIRDRTCSRQYWLVIHFWNDARDGVHKPDIQATS